MDNNTKVLVVDDDLHISELVCIYLNKEGYVTKTASTGTIALELFEQFMPNLVLLDLMLPGIDGNQVCRELKKISSVPIIMVTAKGETFDKVLGLELGADDYIVKPFDPKELIARVKAVLRRFDKKDSNDKNKIVIPNLIINPTTYTITYREVEMEIPPKEFELIYFFANHPNQVFTRDQLLNRIWGYEFMGDTRTVDVHIKRVREKFTQEESWSLKTVWGVGYKFEMK